MININSSLPLNIGFTKKPSFGARNISVREITDYFEKLNDTRGSYKLAQINLAIEKQKNGYQVVKNALVTDFWNK